MMQEILAKGVTWLGWTLRRAERLGRMVLDLVARRRHRTQGGSSAVDARYRRLLDSVVAALPVDPPPDLRPRFERRAPGESDLVRQVARLAATAVVRQLSDARATEPAVMARRDQHAKHHGCVRAEFVVRDDLPPEFAVGVFRPGVRYEAVLRFSNSQGQPQADRKMDGRGMAIKLEGAAGENLLDGALSKAVASGDQDFVLANHPVFFGRDVPDYARFMMVLHRPRDTWRQQLLWWVRFILYFLLRPRLGLIFFRHSRKKVASPLTETYHSMAAYLLGEDSVVRYVATPVGAQLPTPDATSDDYLREALVAALDPLRPAPSGQSLPAFDFAIQVRAAPTPDDAEDASRAWDGPDDRVVPVARIVIGRQDVAAPAGLYACEGLSFNPWNAQPEHRPIGGLNRMRLAVYLASTQVRRRLNLTNAA